MLNDGLRLNLGVAQNQNAGVQNANTQRTQQGEANEVNLFSGNEQVANEGENLFGFDAALEEQGLVTNDANSVNANSQNATINLLGSVINFFGSMMTTIMGGVATTNQANNTPSTPEYTGRSQILDGFDYMEKAKTNEDYTIKKASFAMKKAFGADRFAGMRTEYSDDNIAIINGRSPGSKYIDPSFDQLKFEKGDLSLATKAGYNKFQNEVNNLIQSRYTNSGEVWVVDKKSGRVELINQKDNSIIEAYQYDNNGNLERVDIKEKEAALAQQKAQQEAQQAAQNNMIMSLMTGFFGFISNLFNLILAEPTSTEAQQTQVDDNVAADVTVDNTVAVQAQVDDNVAADVTADNTVADQAPVDENVAATVTTPTTEADLVLEENEEEDEII